MFKNKILFFRWLVEKQYLLFVVWFLLISCHISTRLPARSWLENRMVKRVFARTSLLLCSLPEPRRISVIILWRQRVVQVNMFWPWSSLSGVSWKPQRWWNVSELFTKTKTVKIYFVALLLGSPRSCSWYYPSPSVDPLGEFSWSRSTVFKARSWLSR